MKRLALITCATALGVFATASVANAAAPEVSKKNCEPQSGTFSNDQGTKTCTTVATDTEVSGRYSSTVGSPSSPLYLRGDFHYVFTVQATTARSEKGNGDVTTTTTTQILSHQVVPDACYETVFGITAEVDTSVCAQQGVYPPSS